MATVIKNRVTTSAAVTTTARVLSSPDESTVHRVSGNAAADNIFRVGGQELEIRRYLSLEADITTFLLLETGFAIKLEGL